MSEAELRYTFSCPTCGGSFSIHVERIPPVRARFSCPKCGKAMDFPSRDEARVYVMLAPEGGVAGSGTPLAVELPFRAARVAEPPARSAPAPKPPPPPAPAAKPQPPPAPAQERDFVRTSVPLPQADVPDTDSRYTVDKTGFEGESYSRRAMRILIRTRALNEADPVRLGEADPVRADLLPDLKSLFELRKNARFTPPTVCRKHTDQLAHYMCATTSRPLCEDCAAEKKYGGTSVRVCEHCGGTIAELPVEPL